MTKVIPGIYQLTLSFENSFLEDVNVYLIEGQEGHILVDTGWNTDEAFRSLEEQLLRHGIKIADIEHIVVTHAHSDHWGMAGRLKEHCGARLYLHQLEPAESPAGGDYSRFLQELGDWLTINGVPPGELPQAQPFPFRWGQLVSPATPDIRLQGSEVITNQPFSFRVIWTPGHAAGHICLYEPNQQVLLSGDHVLPSITSNISLRPKSAANPLGDFLQSLRNVSQLDVRLVLPAHGTPFTNLKQRVAELFQHHEHRMNEALTLLKDVPQTAYQLCLHMTWKLDITPEGVPGHELEVWNRRMAVMEALSHLEALRADGQVDKFTQNGKVLYQLN